MPTLEEIERERPKSVDLPAPTAWPMVLAFGVTLLFAGLVTDLGVSAVGAILLLAGAVGWFREVLPHEREETVPVAPLLEFPVSLRESVARLARRARAAPRPAAARDRIRSRRGSRAVSPGSVAMAVLAVLYGDREAGQRLVPDQPARRRGVGEARRDAAGGTAPVPRRRPPARRA